MRELFNVTIQIISLDIFIGYGIYSAVYLLISLFKKDSEFLKKMDLAATGFIIFSGLIYALMFLIQVLWFFANGNPAGLGPYWIQPAIWVIATQLPRIKGLRDKRFIRFIIALLLIFSVERYVIIVTSFHRKFVFPLSGLSVTEVVFGLLLKMAFFCFLALGYAFVVKQINHTR